jgi:AraC-like DNA-binding protein
MDALSHVLKSVRLEGAFYLQAEFTAPWCTRGSGLASVRDRLGAADHVAFFHFLTEGACKFRLADDGEEIEAVAGDLVLFPHDDRHVMGSDLRLAPVETDSLDCDAAAADGELIQMRHGGGGAPARLVCGYLACNRSLSRPLLQALPRMLRVTVGDQHATAVLHELLCFGVRESLGARPGAASLLAKLAELIVVEALRRYTESLPPGRKGWLAGVRDAQVGRALALLHREPQRAWTVEELAREVALSRSALAERFAALVGEPPIQYLARWRLALAAQALRAGEDAIARVAERSGYESNAAFSRAFKREFGVAPAAWRNTGTR